MLAQQNVVAVGGRDEALTGQRGEVLDTEIIDGYRIVCEQAKRPYGQTELMNVSAVRSLIDAAAGGK